MSDAEIMASYERIETVEGIIRDLSRSGLWQSRLYAAQLELIRRKAQSNQSPKDTP